MAIAIGDIHGCLAPLEALIERLPPDEELVFLGDYVDRGPASAQVVRYVSRLAARRPCVLLMGNHERMMADAIADEREIAIWLFNGGETTLASYGVSAAEWVRAPDRAALLPGFLEFFGDLALYHEDRHAIYVHAGVDPDQPDLSRQDPHVLLWIRDRFHRNASAWTGKPIVFGHTPTITMGRADHGVYRDGPLTGIDTACVYGGFLTALDTATGRLYQVPHRPERMTHAG